MKQRWRKWEDIFVVLISCWRSMENRMYQRWDPRRSVFWPWATRIQLTGTGIHACLCCCTRTSVIFCRVPGSIEVAHLWMSNASQQGRHDSSWAVWQGWKCPMGWWERYCRKERCRRVSSSDCRLRIVHVPALRFGDSTLKLENRTTVLAITFRKASVLQLDIAHGGSCS